MRKKVTLLKYHRDNVHVYLRSMNQQHNHVHLVAASILHSQTHISQIMSSLRTARTDNDIV